MSSRVNCKSKEEVDSCDSETNNCSNFYNKNKNLHTYILHIYIKIKLKIINF